MTFLDSRYNYNLVVLSVLIAILAAGAALDLAGRVTASHGRTRALWLTGGAFAMGLGIWSMHYTGMLAFDLAIPLAYHVPTVALSLLAAVLASGVALSMSSRQHLTTGHLILGSLVMGAGIATMHYTGMAAMRQSATARYDAGLVALSVVIAIGVSAVAMRLAFRHGHAPSEAWTWRKAGSALLMGAAIPSMHYTGMAAARFFASDAPVALADTMSISDLGADAIGAGTVVILLAAIGTSVLDRWVGAERLRTATLLAEHERRLADAQAIAHVGSWEWDIKTNVVTWSDELRRTYGLPPGAPAGYHEFLAVAHPDDRPRLEALVAEGIRTHRTIDYDWRVVRPDGVVRYMQARNVVITDATGGAIRMAGTSLDITERKLADENQRTLLRELQASLAEVKVLQGILPICATCKRIKGDDGTWEAVESYVREHTNAEFTHGLCPDCAKKTWGGSVGLV